MIGLLAAIGVLVTVILGLTCTERGRRLGTITNRATPALTSAESGAGEPARDRSLDASSRPCDHSTRPAAVVPHTYTAPVRWVCPDCWDVVPEPAPLGPVPNPETSGPGARSDRDTASSLPGTVSTGSTTITANRITAGTITADRLFPPPPPGGPFRRVAADGVSPATGDATDVYERDYAEIRSHQTAAVIRTLALPGPALAPTSSITYANADADAAMHRTNLAALLDHGGLTPSEVRGALSHYDRQTGRGWPIDPADDTRPL